MSRKFFTVPQLLFLIFLVLGQSGLGFGQGDLEENGTGRGGNGNIAPTFTAVSSHFFHPGTDYKVFLTVDPHATNKPLQLKCVLLSNSDNRTEIQSDSISLRPGQSGQVSIPMPEERPGGETVWRLFAWSFTENSDAEDYQSYAPHTLIVSRTLPNPDGLSPNKAELQAVFIQTDKPAYKPEDLVRIRVITMDSNDLPHLTAGVNMTITDSKGTIMKKWEQPLELPESASQPSNVSSNENVALFGEFQKKINGLSSYEYQLSTEPIFGNWTIQVEAGNIRERMYFDVQKYILPKFQVKIEAPSVLYASGVISAAAKVQVSYTYGKGLHGTGNVTVTSSNETRTTIHQIVVKDGEVIVPLTLSSPRTHSTVHTITANVTEKNTKRWQTGKATVRIYPQETYTVQWINKPASYKPGLPITVQLKITAQDGLPVSDARTNSLRITFPSPLNLPDREASIPPSGIVTLSFPTPLQPLPANSRFQVQYKTFTFPLTLPNAETGTSSGIFIEVVSPADSINLIQGKSYNFTIRSNRPIQPDVFHSLLWDDAAMEAHGAQTIINTPGEPATEFPFSLEIPKAAYTDLKVFVYFETDEGGSRQMISAFKAVNTHNYLKIRVSRPIPEETSPTPAPSPDGQDGSTTTTSAPPTTEPETTTESIDYEEEDGFQRDAGAPESQNSSRLEVEPGAAVEIHFETDPDSTIAIRGIDQSLLLLTQQDNDLNQARVHSKRASSQIKRSQLDNLPSEVPSFLRTFQRLGISVLNSKAFTSFRPLDLSATSLAGEGGPEREGDNEDIEEPEVAPPGEDDDEVPDESLIPDVDSRLRTVFPETWLWDEFQSSSNSNTTVLSKTLPDTLTSWIISGFSLNSKTGLGVASPASVTGFMPFFVTLNLPYAVYRYEAFDLQVIVHNYLDRDVNVWVTLYNKQNNSDFSFVDDRERKNGVAHRYIKVARNHVQVAHFVIMPIEIGEIPIEVKAVTEDGDAADSILRFLKVKPEGQKQSRTQSIVFDPKSGDKNQSRTRDGRLDVAFPTRQVVKGSNSLQMTVFGDSISKMASTLDSDTSSDLGYLLVLPKGCAEQTMSKFVPNILVLRYLNATNSEDKDVMRNARTNLETGYGNEMKYRNSDGSFSTYGQGFLAWLTSYWKGYSVWLTSYVIKWFIAAQKYITIDNHVITSGINFLRREQKTDGSFSETGDYYHLRMGGKNGANGVAVTAYITLALIEAQEASNSDLDLKVAIQNGMNFISKESVYQLEDNFITNLVTATLIAGNHREKTRFFEKMERAATVTTTTGGVNVKYWDTINSRERASGALAVEMTSYALLAHLWRSGRMDSSAVDIHRWLLSQRNSNGGFKSTQDTVMGLTALTAYALRTVSTVRDEDELHLKIRASSNSARVPDTEISSSVLRWNRLVLQEFNLPISTKVVNVRATGSGPALIQVTESWYVAIKSRPGRGSQPSFVVTANMTIPEPEEPTETELRLCVSSLQPNGARDSIGSIELPSGYVFSRGDYEAGSEFMAQRPENVLRFELTEGNSKLDVYYSYVRGHPAVCITLPATRQFEVANGKNPPIHVYEYLNPENTATITYVPAHKYTICQLCQSTGACHPSQCG